MNKLIKLIVVLLKNSSSITVSKSKVVNNLFVGFLIVCLIPFAVSLNQMTKYLYEILEPLDQQGVLIAYALVGVGMIFFFGIFYVLGTFYYAKDIELLLHMPFSPYQIIGAKLVTVVVYEYIVTAFMYLPVVLTFGYLSQAGLVFYLYSLLIFILLPILPLIIGGILVMLIMAFTSFGKRKEFMTFAGTLLVLVVALVFILISLIGIIVFLFIGEKLYFKDVEQLMNLIMSSDLITQKIAVFFGIGVLFGSMNGITATGISREGSSAYVMKYIPTPMLTQVGAKIILCILLGAFGTLVFGLGTIYLGLDLGTDVIAMLISINGIVLVALSGMIIDLTRPKLVWDNEQQAVKQNLNTILNLVIGGGLGFGLGFVVFMFDLNLIITLLIYVGLIGVVNVVLYKYMVNKSLHAFILRDI